MAVEVKLSEDFANVVLVPNPASGAPLLASVLREHGLPAKRSAEGFIIESHQSDLLLDIPNLNIRWTREARTYCENRKWVKRVRNSVSEAVKTILAGSRSLSESQLRRVKTLSVLDDHQITSVAAMTVPGGYGLSVFDEQGAGKTVTLIFAYDELVEKNEVDFALIVAPKSMIAEWPQDFRKFRGDLYDVGVASGSRKEKEAIIRAKHDVLITNFDTVTAMETELSNLLRKHGRRSIIVVDESFFIKNNEAKRTRALIRLRELSGRAFVLCGTPAPNSPHDILEQFNFVDFGTSFSGVAIPKDIDAARSVIQARIDDQALYVRNLKKDVLPNLPDKNFIEVEVVLQPQQAQLYHDALGKLVSDLRAVDDLEFNRNITSFLARRVALLQICSNPVSITDGYTEVPAKLLALDRILEQTITQNREKVVVWSFYRASIDAIFNRFAKFNPVRFDGSISDINSRREAVDRFQNDDETMLMVANPAAAGAGLTLHRSRIAVYESMSNQAAHYLQSLDRIHRRGQSRQVEYMVLLCSQSIEIDEYRRLIQKERNAQELLGDPITTPFTRQLLLDEALASLGHFERAVDQL